jgi:hypothetical protein
MAKADAGNRVFSYHNAIGAGHAEDPRTNLEAAGAIVRVNQYGLDAFLDAELQLALMRETQEVALHPLTGLMTDLGFRAFREHPTITAESFHDFIGGDEPVTSRKAFVWACGKGGLGKCDHIIFVWVCLFVSTDNFILELLFSEASFYFRF